MIRLVPQALQYRLPDFLAEKLLVNRPLLGIQEHIVPRQTADSLLRYKGLLHWRQYVDVPKTAG